MNRDKLIDIITEANAFYVIDKDDIGIADQYEMSHKLANHLIANGIGDITAEKHRADVAERALESACEYLSENCIYDNCLSEVADDDSTEDICTNYCTEC